MDGFVKVWYFETIDLADPPDDDRFVEVEPIFELEVGDDLGPAALMCMQRKHAEDAGDNTWFAQVRHDTLLLLLLTLGKAAALVTVFAGRLGRAVAAGPVAVGGRAGPAAPVYEPLGGRDGAGVRATRPLRGHAGPGGPSARVQRRAQVPAHRQDAPRHGAGTALAACAGTTDRSG